MLLDLVKIQDPEPTYRQLKALDFIEEVLELDTPQEAKDSFFKCSEWLDLYLEKAEQQNTNTIGEEPFEMFHSYGDLDDFLTIYDVM